GIETALITVRPGDGHRLNRAHQRWPDLAGRLNQGGGHQTDRVIGVHRPIRGLNDRSAIRGYPNLVESVAMLIRRPESSERFRPLLAGDPKRHEGHTVQPLGVISELLTNERVLPGRSGVYGDVPSG